MVKNNRKMVLYQVLPRLFGNDCTRRKVGGTLAENGSGKFSAFTPQALDSIRDMGVSHVWYTGVLEQATCSDFTTFGIPLDHPSVVKGEAGSPYAIKDYYDVSPDLADEVPLRMQEFEALVERTHQAGMGVIIDFVPNHVAREYRSDAAPAGVKALGEDDDVHTSFSVTNNFYYLPGQSFVAPVKKHIQHKEYHEQPAKATGNDCFTAHPKHTDWYETVKLNYGIDYWGGGGRHFDPVPDTWNKMLAILLFWADKGIDGFRCDMVEMVPVPFWNWAIAKVKKRFPKLVFIAEIYNPYVYREYIDTGGFDYLYDKVGLYDTLRAIIVGEQSASTITACWQAVEGIQDKMLSFLENHDEQRIASDFFASNPFKALPAVLVMALQHTNPVLVYSGQELGERGMDVEGFSGRDGRTTIFDYWSLPCLMRWRKGGKYSTKNLLPEEATLREQYVRILTLCREEQAVVQGSFFDLQYAQDEQGGYSFYHQYAFLRQYEDDLLLVVVNFEAIEKWVQLSIPDHAWKVLALNGYTWVGGTDLLTTGDGASNEVFSSQLTICLPANKGVVLKYKRKEKA